MGYIYFLSKLMQLMDSFSVSTLTPTGGGFFLVNAIIMIGGGGLFALTQQN